MHVLRNTSFHVHIIILHFLKILRVFKIYIMYSFVFIYDQINVKLEWETKIENLQKILKFLY